MKLRYDYVGHIVSVWLPYDILISFNTRAFVHLHGASGDADASTSLQLIPSMYFALAKKTKRIDIVDLELKKELSKK